MELLRRALGRAVQRGLVPPAWAGFRFPRCATLEPSGSGVLPTSVSLQKFDRIHAPFDLSQAPLQAQGADVLDRARFNGRAMQSAESFTTTLRDCAILTCEDRWGNPKRALFDADGRVVLVHGFAYVPDHGKMWADHGRDAVASGEVCWALGRWPKNHCHWLTQDLPSILLALELGYSDTIIVPGSKCKTSFNSHCMSVLGLTANPSTAALPPVMRIRELTLVRAGAYHPRSVRSVRERFSGPQPASGRRIYLSREGAHYRKFANEPEVRSGLERRGFETICMERLQPAAQISVMSEAGIVVGLHGAGMSNIVFCQQGTHVLEALDSGWRSGNQLNHRLLSAATGLSYRSFDAAPANPAACGGYRDVVLDTASFFNELDQRIDAAAATA